MGNFLYVEPNKKLYIDEKILIKNKIISFSFIETPNFLLYTRFNNQNFKYFSSINRYPDFIYKNDNKTSKNCLKNIEIYYIYYDFINNKYDIEDVNKNFYKIYCNQLTINTN